MIRKADEEELNTGCNSQGKGQGWRAGNCHPRRDEGAFGVGGAAFLAQSSLGSLGAVLGSQTGSEVATLPGMELGSAPQVFTDAAIRLETQCQKPVADT